MLLLCAAYVAYTNRTIGVQIYLHILLMSVTVCFCSITVWSWYFTLHACTTRPNKKGGWKPSWHTFEESLSRRIVHQVGCVCPSICGLWWSLKSLIFSHLFPFFIQRLVQWGEASWRHEDCDCCCFGFAGHQPEWVKLQPVSICIIFHICQWGTFGRLCYCSIYCI